MADQLTREEVEQMMAENLERIHAIVDSRISQEVSPQETTNLEFQEMRRNYKMYNATTVPVLPRGTMIVIDTRPKLGASGVVAKYTSLGDRYVEEWAKQVNP